MVPTTLEDTRPIAGLTNDYVGVDIAWVGSGGVTEIVAYPEPGQCAYVPYFAVKKGDEIFKRVPSGAVTVTYKTP